jgi:hypothetical protein
MSQIIYSLLLALALFVVPGTASKAETFDFVALGDTAYNPPDDYPAYDALIGKINAANPAFTIHIGDTWGIQKCDDAAYEHVLTFFDKYDHPVVYTPGDNEWTDCNAFSLGVPTFETMFLAPGPVDPVERLGALRGIFFSKAQSLGAKPMPLTRQGDGEAHPQMVENAVWQKKDVVFGTLHVVGSNNGLVGYDENVGAEYVARSRANIAWLDKIFAKAQAENAKAVVIALHAEMFGRGYSSGLVKEFDYAGHELNGGTQGPYFALVWKIRDLAVAFGKPVLLIHGDAHRFVIDRPFLVSKGENHPPVNDNITRLQVYGAPELKAVRVSVDTETEWVFSFSPLY